MAEDYDVDAPIPDTATPTTPIPTPAPAPAGRSLAERSLAERSLADLITERPALAGVFDRLGLDFCCHGGETLARACRASGIEPSVVEAAVAGAADAGAGDDRSDGWADLDPGGLCDHIESVHHGYLHAELPELVALAAKVASVHASRHPELTSVEQLVRGLEADFVQHLNKEDRVLFPAIRRLTGGPATFPFGSVRNPIAVMTSEHETVGGTLEQLRRLTGGYEVPGDACASYRLLYRRLQALESDTHLHVFKENSVLFPAAVELEARQAPKQAV